MLRLIVLVAFFGSCALAVWAAPLPPMLAVKWIGVAAAGVAAACIGSAILDRVYYGQRVRGFPVIVRWLP